MSETQLPPQLYVGLHRPNMVRPVRNRAYGDVKPAPGTGFWTSTYDPRLGSGWVQWCLTERAFLPDGGRWRSWLLHPQPARIATVDSLLDLDCLIEQYGHDQDRWRFLDWERLAVDYDALHLTDDGQWATRLSEPNLYGWDCESTLWFRWCFERVEELGDVDWASRSLAVEAADG